MKTVKRYRPCPAYPNAADNVYIAHRITSVLAALASGVGFVGTMLLLVAFV